MNQSKIVFAFGWWSNRTRNHVALSQAESANLALRDIDVLIATALTGCAKESVSVTKQIKNPGSNQLVGGFGYGRKNLKNQFGSLSRNSLDAFIDGHLAKFIVCLGTKVS
jgi:hypothetical protein